MTAAVELKKGTVVLLGGYRQHGKDTFFRHISGEQRDYAYEVSAQGEPFCFPCTEYRRVAFADVLKRDCADILGLTVEELERRKDEPLSAEYAFKCTTPANDPPTHRDVLIDHAAYCRALDPNYYVRRVVDDLSEHCVTVVTDFRYPNEYDFLVASGKHVVAARLTRAGAPVPSPAIVSEHQLDTFYFQIHINCL